VQSKFNTSPKMDCSQAVWCTWPCRCAGAWWAARAEQSKQLAPTTYILAGRVCSSARDLNIGDLVMIERGRSKALCQ